MPRFSVAGHCVVRCEPCDLEWVFPSPSLESIASVYSTGYFQGSGAGYSSYFESERASNQRKAQHRLLRLKELGARAGQRLLDIGAADGTFVAAALAAGFDAYGVEVSNDAHDAAAAELRPRLLRNLEQASAIGPFEVVTLWDVLEHLPDMDGTLRQLARVLHTGGLMGLVVPVIDNWNARNDPLSWDQYKPPEHLSYFSSRSLCALLQTRVGPVVHQEPAWTRYARRFGVSSESKTRLRALLAYFEEGAFRIAASLGAVNRANFLDSLLVVARASDVRR
ncbi:MAG TPA: class I SAM-dependent methyltransferase [Polyangiaceae bacterium]